jgi:predicted nicotinamide N-methyase
MTGSGFTRGRADAHRLALDRLVVGGVQLDVERPAEPESLIDEDAFADDEFLPYWAERWPSGIALAEQVSTRHDLRGRRVLEIGCGLGLPSLIAARLGADVVATDWSADAIALLERNASRNGLRVTAVPADWRDTDAIVSLGPFDLVVAADVLYEERNAVPILTLLATLGAPATIADPGRRHADGFLDAVRTDGWEIDTVRDARIPQGGIHRLSRVRPS